MPAGWDGLGGPLGIETAYDTASSFRCIVVGMAWEAR